MARILLGLSGLYFILGIGLGLYMGLIADYRLAIVYAHIASLGFLGLGLIGVLYLLVPALSYTIFASIHFWLHIIGVPLLLIGLTLTQLDAFVTGHTIALLGMVLMMLSAVAFTINILTNARVQVRN